MLIGELRQFKRISLRHVVYEDRHFKQHRRDAKEGEFFIILEDGVRTLVLASRVLLHDGVGWLVIANFEYESARITDATM